MPLAAVAGIGAIGSIVGGVVGSNAASHAADTQAAAANNAANLERQSAIDALNFNKQQYGNSLSLLSPFYNTGVSANSRLAYLMGLNPAQGLPAGVINPSAPPAPASTLDASSFDPSTLDQLRALRNGGVGPNGIPRPMQGNAAMINPNALPQNNPTPPGTPSTGNTLNTNTPITSPGTQQNPYQMTMKPPIFSGGPPGGAAGMIGANGQVTPDVNPMPNGTNLGTVNPPTNANGSPGTVPQTGNTGGGNFSLGPINPNIPAGEGGFGFPGQGSPTVLPDSGGFGSLAQGWNQQFQSPTAVTEQNDPGYQFRLAQGQQALQNSAAARGGLLSGGTAKALTDYNQNAASGEYGNVYNRALQNYNTNYNTFTNDQTNLFNRLMALQSGGQVSANNLSASGITAANNAANIGLTSAGQIGQQINNAGAATASGYVGSGNAITGAINGATGSLSTLAMLRLLQNGGGGAAANPSAGYGVY